MKLIGKNTVDLPKRLVFTMSKTIEDIDPYDWEKKELFKINNFSEPNGIFERLVTVRI